MAGDDDLEVMGPGWGPGGSGTRKVTEYLRKIQFDVSPAPKDPAGFRLKAPRFGRNSRADAGPEVAFTRPHFIRGRTSGGGGGKRSAGGLLGLGRRESGGNRSHQNRHHGEEAQAGGAGTSESVVESRPRLIGSWRGGGEVVGWPLMAAKARAAAAPSRRGRPGPRPFGGVGERKAGTEGWRPGSLSGGEDRTAALHAAVAPVFGILTGTK